MNACAILGLLATAVYLTVAAAVPEYTSKASNMEKRVESTFAWREYFVRNCTTPTLSASDEGENTIKGEHCENLAAWQSANNGGYYELWDFEHFNNFTYRPIVGHDTCVVALSHPNPDVANGYAIMGSLDVTDLMANALSQYQLVGKMPTIFGEFVCGPNLAPLNIIIYNGRTGWQGIPPKILSEVAGANYSTVPNFTAVPTSMNGPAINGSYTTGSPPTLPVVTLVPADTEGGT